MSGFLVPADRGTGRAGDGPPRFSVVIAAYQAADVIGEAIDSVLAQTLPAHEIVVSDDGSTDDLAETLAPYGDRVRFLRHERKTGEAGAKNRGVEAATGEFAVILDADDVFLPERLERLAALAAERPDLDVLTSDAWLTVDGDPVRRCYADGWTFETGDQRRGILQRNFIFGLVAVRRAALLEAGGYDPAIRHTTDWDLWARMILGAGARVGCVDQPLAEYRIRPTSLSADRIRMSEGRLQSLANAAAHPSLSADERRVAADAIALERRRLALERARAALAAGAPDARRRSLEVVLGRRMGAMTRAKAAVAVLAPGLSGARLRADGGGYVGAGGIRVTAEPAGGAPSDPGATRP